MIYISTYPLLNLKNNLKQYQPQMLIITFISNHRNLIDPKLSMPLQDEPMFIPKQDLRIFMHHKAMQATIQMNLIIKLNHLIQFAISQEQMHPIIYYIHFTYTIESINQHEFYHPYQLATKPITMKQVLFSLIHNLILFFILK